MSNEQVLHVKIQFEVFGQKYYRNEKLYACEGIEDVVGLENKLLDFQKKLNAEGFKESEFTESDLEAKSRITPLK